MSEKFLRLILFALLLTPLWFLSIFLFPFITTKVLYFRLLVEAALLIYLILALKQPELRPRWNWLTRLVWIYLGIVFLTSLLGVNFSKSFWGTVERGEGIITLLHFAVYFTMLTGVLRSRQDWFKYFLFAVSVTALNALYGLAQLLGLPFVIHAGATRISGTIGNASFFAAFMIFGIFLSLFLLSRSSRQEQSSPMLRGYLWAVVILEVIAVYHSRTRGAILALGGAFLLYAIFQMFKSASSRRLKLGSAAAVLLIILAALGLYAFRQSEFVARHNTLYRLATISPKDVTTQSRFDTWRASTQGFKDRFLIGYGYENYNIAFNKYFPARIFKDQGSQIWFDRAHNIIFDIGLTSGLAGLTAYLAIFAVAIWYLLKTARAEQGISGHLILVLLLAAYFGQNIFVFDTQATYLMFFAVLAYVVFLSAPSPNPSHKGRGIQNREFPPTGGHSASSSWSREEGKGGGFFTKSIAAVLIFMIAYFVNFKPAMANYYATLGIKTAKMNRFREVKGVFERSLSYGTYMDEEIRQRLTDHSHEAVASNQLSPQEQSEFYQYTIGQLHKSLEESPSDVKNYLYLMNVLNRLSSNAELLGEVISLGEQALLLSPTRPQIYWELGQAYFSKKDFEAGLKYFKAAVELNPDPKESHLNYLLAAIIAGQEEIAQREFAIITQDLGHKFSANEYLGMARAYLQAKNLPKAIENYERARDLQPNNAELRAKLAAAYGEICDIENARREVSKAVELDPSFEDEAVVFLSQLAEKCQK